MIVIQRTEYTNAPPLHHRWALVLLCWTAMLLASDAPIILARETTGTKPAWLAWAQTAALAASLLPTFLSRPLVPARGLMLAFLAFHVGWSLVLPTVHASGVWMQWRAQAAPAPRMIATTPGG